MSHPLVQFLPDARSLRQPEVSLPSQHIDSQLAYRFFETASARTTSQSPDTLLEHCHRLIGHPAFDLAAGSHPEAVTQELALERAGRRTLGLVDREPQSSIEFPQ